MCGCGQLDKLLRNAYEIPYIGAPSASRRNMSLSPRITEVIWAANLGNVLQEIAIGTEHADLNDRFSTVELERIARVLTREMRFLPGPDVGRHFTAHEQDVIQQVIVGFCGMLARMTRGAARIRFVHNAFRIAPYLRKIAAHEHARALQQEMAWAKRDFENFRDRSPESELRDDLLNVLHDADGLASVRLSLREDMRRAATRTTHTSNVTLRRGYMWLRRTLGDPTPTFKQLSSAEFLQSDSVSAETNNCASDWLGVELTVVIDRALLTANPKRTSGWLWNVATLHTDVATMTQLISTRAGLTMRSN